MLVERAEWAERTQPSERAASEESTIMIERATASESTNELERALAPISHNSRRFLAPVHLHDTVQWYSLYGHGRVGNYRPWRVDPGWYIIRLCACHYGELVVVRPYSDRVEAEAGIWLLVNTAHQLGT